MRDVALQSAVRMMTMALTAMSAFAFVRVPNAHAQDTLMGRYNTKDQIPRELMRASAARVVEQTGQTGSEFAIGKKFYMPPLPGDQGFADSAKESEQYQVQSGSTLPDYGLNSRETVNVSLPPLRGLRQILDSEVTKTLLKDLTVAKANVLMQTYMMVENGAATGFMGGMGIGSDLMSNMLAAQDAQMRMLDVVDDTGKAKEAYVRRVAHLMREGDNKNVWPAAIYMASGESGKKPAETEMKDLKDGARPYNFEHLAKIGKANEEKGRLLSDLIFDPGQSSGGSGLGAGGAKPYSNDKLDGLKKEFVTLVGDTKIEFDNLDEISRKVKYSYTPPTNDADGKRRGVAAINWEEVQVVWENFHNIIADRCEWSKAAKNKSKQTAEKATFCSSKDAVKKKNGSSPWELASAPDMPMTCNLVEQYYEYVRKDMGRKRIVNCDEIRYRADQIPAKGAGDSESNLNNCTGENGCERKRVALNLAFVIARSRTLHTYQNLYVISKRFAVDPAVSELIDLQFSRSLAGMDIEQELTSNRERFGDFLDYFAQLTKGGSGSGNPRPNSGANSVVPGQKTGQSGKGGK